MLADYDAPSAIDEQQQNNGLPHISMMTKTLRLKRTQVSAGSVLCKSLNPRE
jgi:hypothetical protein